MLPSSSVTTDWPPASTGATQDVSHALVPEGIMSLESPEEDTMQVCGMPLHNVVGAFSASMHCVSRVLLPHPRQYVWHFV